MSKEEVLRKSKAASDKFLNTDIYKNADTIMLYAPLGNEIDTITILKAAMSDGKKCVLPVTDFETGDITPCEVNDDTQLKKGAFSVLAPVDKKVVNKEELDVFIVPGIAFDKKGARVGFGKGCYDRLLCGVLATKIGYCYEFQICDEIVSESHDIKMDFLITESGLIRCE